MPNLNKKILKSNIKQILNNFDLDQFSAHFDSEDDFKWLIKGLINATEDALEN
jgi:hypothetical protein